MLRQAQHSDTATLCALSSIHENELLRLLVSRRSDREIAEAFYITRRTVQTHVVSIVTKLGAANRTEAATAVRRTGLVSPLRFPRSGGTQEQSPYKYP